jgi:hypothetical protein
LLLTASVLSAQTREDLLQKVDHFRYPWPEFSVEVALQDGKIKQQWKVTARENGDARVEGVSEKEKGRTVLLLKDQMWLLLPNAKHPVKVSPQQRLLGPAAGGDVARFRFSGDYTPTVEKEEILDKKPVRRLTLQATRKSLSYQTATLWMSQEGIPIQAEFYYASGKLARTAHFGPLVSAQGTQVLSSLQLEEPTGKSVELEFSGWKPVHAGDSLFRLPEQTEPPSP